MTRDMDVQKFEELLGVLKACFEKNLNRYHGLDWAEIQKGWNQPRQSYGR